MIQVIAGLGLLAGVQRHFADEEGDHETRGVIAIGILVALAISLTVFVTLPLWAPPLGYAHTETAIGFAVWFSGLCAITMMLASLMRAQDRLQAFLSIMFLQSLGGQLLGLALVLTVKHTAALYLLGLLIGQSIGLVVSIFLVRPRFDGSKTLRATRKVMAFSLPLVPHLLAALVLNVGDRIVVRRDLGLAAVGRYQLAYNAAGTAILLLSVLNQAWEPRIYAVKTERLRVAVLASARDQLYYLEVPMLIGFSLAAPIVLRILGPPSFQPSSLLMVFTLVSLSAIPFSSYLANQRTILVYRNTAHLAWITPTCAGINILLNILLVPHFGINGSAFATLVSFVLLAEATGVVARKKATIAPTSWHIWLALAIASAVSLALVVAPAASILSLSIRLMGALICGIWGLLAVRHIIVRPNVKVHLHARKGKSSRLVELVLYGPPDSTRLAEAEVR